MEFKTQYYTPMDRESAGNSSPEVSPAANLEEPIIPISDIGATVPEGSRFGSFLQTAQAAIRKGVGSIELSTGMGGQQEPAGAESYGKDAREALREMARANEVMFTSVHTPVQIGNLSGFNPQQGNYSDETRDYELEEVKKAIKFAADVSQGGAVVVHTGEFNRTMFDAPWNKNGMFEAYEEESQKAVKQLVDTRTGKLITEVRLNQIVPQAKWKRAGNDYTDANGKYVKTGDYTDYDGNKVDRTARVPEFNKNGEVIIEERKFSDFFNEAGEINREKEKAVGRPLTPEETVTPEEAFLYATTETQERIARGYALYYGMNTEEKMKSIKKMKESLKYYEELEKTVPKDQHWKLMQKMEPIIGGLVPSEDKLPSQILKDAIKNNEKAIEEGREMMTGQLQSAKEQELLRKHAVSAWKYAKQKTAESYGEAGIYAMEESLNNPYANRDIFVAPENIFPEMGFGSHPDELIELVKTGRAEMARRLVKDYGYDQKKADETSKRFIKATLDTQHLGMWWKHFKQKPGESYEAKKERFDQWYLNEVERLQKEGVVGYVHLVDSMGGGHHHLPAGQGDLPVVEAVKKLKSLGFKGMINSEGHEEESRFGQGRMMVETWKAFGSPLFGRAGYFGGFGGAMPQTWTEVQSSYFGRTYPPRFIFGSYAPSNDWHLWSEVPME